MGAFEKAWTTLKADPNMLDTQGRSIPPALANPQNFDIPTGDAERSFQSIRDAVLAADMPYHDNLRQHLLGRIHRTPRPSAYHWNRNADEEEAEDMRQNERRFGPLSSVLAQDTDEGREFHQYKGPDVSNMYAPVPQPSQFEKAWATLKALPEQQVLGPDDQPLKTLHPAIQGMMERRGTLQPEGQEIQNIGHAPGFMPLSYGRDTSEAVYPRVGVPGREIRDDENFDTATERLTRERNEAIPTEGALQGGYLTSMRPQTDLTISEGYPYEIPERGIYTSEEGYPEYATDRHPYTARFASMYGEPETMDEKFKHGYGRFMGK